MRFWASINNIYIDGNKFCSSSIVLTSKSVLSKISLLGQKERSSAGIACSSRLIVHLKLRIIYQVKNSSSLNQMYMGQKVKIEGAGSHILRFGLVRRFALECMLRFLQQKCHILSLFETVFVQSPHTLLWPTDLRPEPH